MIQATHPGCDFRGKWLCGYRNYIDGLRFPTDSLWSRQMIQGQRNLPWLFICMSFFKCTPEIWRAHQPRARRPHPDILCAWGLVFSINSHWGYVRGQKRSNKQAVIRQGEKSSFTTWIQFHFFFGEVLSSRSSCFHPKFHPWWRKGN